MHVDGIEHPLVASRSETAIARDVALALEQPGARRADGSLPGQDRLF